MHARMILNFWSFCLYLLSAGVGHHIQSMRCWDQSQGLTHDKQTFYQQTCIPSSFLPVVLFFPVCLSFFLLPTPYFWNKDFLLAKAGLKHSILLHQPPEHWNYKQTPQGLSFYKDLFLLLFMCICVCDMCDNMCRFPQRPEEGAGSPEAEVCG